MVDPFQDAWTTKQERLALLEPVLAAHPGWHLDAKHPRCWDDNDVALVRSALAPGDVEVVLLVSRGLKGNDETKFALSQFLGRSDEVFFYGKRWTPSGTLTQSFSLERLCLSIWDAHLAFSRPTLDYYRELGEGDPGMNRVRAAQAVSDYLQATTPDRWSLLLHHAFGKWNLLSGAPEVYPYGETMRELLLPEGDAYGIVRHQVEGVAQLMRWDSQSAADLDFLFGESAARAPVPMGTDDHAEVDVATLVEDATGSTVQFTFQF